MYFASQTCSIPIYVRSLYQSISLSFITTPMLMVRFFHCSNDNATKNTLHWKLSLQKQLMVLITI